MTTRTQRDQERRDKAILDFLQREEDATKAIIDGMTPLRRAIAYAYQNGQGETMTGISAKIRKLAAEGYDARCAVSTGFWGGGGWVP